MADRIEKLCKKSFDKYLSKKYDKALVEWQDLSDINEDPPDFKLILNNKDFAVEVSQFKVKNKSATGDRINELTYMHSMDRFVGELRDEATKAGNLMGTYVVTFFRPISNFNKRKTEWMNTFIDYISNTKSSSSCEERSIEENNIKVCEIKKYNNDSDLVESAFVGACEWIYSKDHLDKVYAMLQNVILTKKEKLESKNVKEPKVLLLFNSYGLAGKHIYNKIIEEYKISDLNYYDSIYIIEDDGEGYFIHSKNSFD